MKCCKKWKEANRVGWLDEDEYWVWYKRKEINFCPQCGSSLKERGDCSKCRWQNMLCVKNGECHFSLKQESKWCEECANWNTDKCNECYQSKDKPSSQFLYKEPSVKPKPKLPKKIDLKKWAELDAKSDWVGYPDFSYVDNLIEKYNQLIDYLEAKK